MSKYQLMNEIHLSDFLGKHPALFTNLILLSQLWSSKSSPF